MAEHLADLARDLQAQASLDETLDAIMHAAVANIFGAEHASIMTVEKHQRVRTMAASGELARTADRAQHESGEGPCLVSLYQDRTVRAPDLASDHRWPEFAKRAVDLGVGSMLAVQLYVKGEDLGALNLLSANPGGFDEDSEELAVLFGTHAAIALADAEQRENLTIALITRDVIGQAKGILMERHKVTADEAFRLLVQASQARHRKLRDLAGELTATGELPAAPRH